MLWDTGFDPWLKLRSIAAHLSVVTEASPDHVRLSCIGDRLLIEVDGGIFLLIGKASGKEKRSQKGVERCVKLRERFGFLA